jgi:regulator of replication initiation timing
MLNIGKDPVKKFDKKLKKDKVTSELQAVKDKLDVQIEENQHTLYDANELMEELDRIRMTAGKRKENYRQMKVKLEELL